MSFSVPFWNWFWHIFGLCAILAICLPSKTLKKISTRMSLHHPIPESRVHDMRLGLETIVDAERVELVISEYNKANFLYRRPRVPKLDARAEHELLVWTLGKGRRVQQYTLFNGSRQNQVEVVRTRGRRAVAFSLQSSALYKLLDNKQADDRN